MTDVKAAKTAIINYLKDETKGNSNPHSYRTMLLTTMLCQKELTDNACSEEYYNACSEEYDFYLNKLKKRYDYKEPPPEKKENKETILQQLYRYLFNS